MRPLTTPLVLLLGLGLLLTACAGSAAIPEDPAPSDPAEVKVTLSDFKIEMSQTEFQTGVPYEFVVTNNGAVAHELMLMAPVEDGTMDMEEMDEMAVAMFEDEELTPGVTVTQTITFPAPGDSSLEAACHLPGHYEAGMRLPLTITS